MFHYTQMGKHTFTMLSAAEAQQLAQSHRNSKPVQSVTVTPLTLQRRQGFSTDAWDRGPTVIEQASQRTPREEKKAGSQQQEAPHTHLSLLLDRYTPSPGRVDHQSSPYLSRQSGPAPVFSSLLVLEVWMIESCWSVVPTLECPALQWHIPRQEN